MAARPQPMWARLGGESAAVQPATPAEVEALSVSADTEEHKDEPAKRPVTLTSKNQNWTTPQHLCEAIRAFGGGEIGLDPCSNAQSLVKAEEEWTEGALERSWRGFGLVYANPPYSRKRPTLQNWVKYAADQFAEVYDDELLLLVPARTDTKWFRRQLVDRANAILFFTGRLKFGGVLNEKGEPIKDAATFPSALAYWGKRSDKFERDFDHYGWMARLR